MAAPALLYKDSCTFIFLLAEYDAFQEIKVLATSSLGHLGRSLL